MLAHKWRDFETKHPSSCQSTRSCGTWTPAQAPATSALQGSRGARAAANNVRSLPPMSRLRHMLPCLEAVEGRRGRLGHRSTFSTCQCARSIGASTGVDPQRNGGRRRRIGLAGHDQCRSAARRPPKRRRRGGTGMQIFRGDRSNHCACDGPLEYRNRTSSNPSGIFSHRSGISTSLVTGTRPGGRRTCFWTAPGARLCRPP